MEKKVFIGIPTYDKQKYCVDEFIKCLKELTYKNVKILFADNSENENYAKFLRSKGFDVLRNPVKGDNIDMIISNTLALRKKFLEGDCDYLLFLDSDIMVPEDVIEKLIKHDKPIISAICLTEQNLTGKNEVWPALRMKSEKEGFVHPVPIDFVLGDNLLEIAACGFGCCLIKRNVVEAIKELKRSEGNLGGEDFLFCYDALKKGFKTFAACEAKCVHVKEDKRFDFPVMKAGFGISYNFHSSQQKKKEFARAQ